MRSPLTSGKPLKRCLEQPLFDYADVTCCEISEGCCKEFQRVRNREARIILQRKTSKDSQHVLNGLSLASGRKLYKCCSVFKPLNNWVPKYLTQYLTRYRAFHDHATRRSNVLNPLKTKHNMG